MALNVVPLTKGMHFDSPPFVLVNLILSFTAAFQAPIILMSQNRQAARDKRESVIGFAVNWNAEREIEDIPEHLHNGEASVKFVITTLKSMKTEPTELRTQVAALKALS